MGNEVTADFLIVGAGIMGLALAREIKEKDPAVRIAVVEKEPVPAWHASGRNSGVLHAGFTYTSDSLKALFTREGNRLWRDYCREKGLATNPCGKVVVARNEAEVEGIRELKRRGDKNGVEVTVVDERELAQIEPNARTCGIALWSPTTTTVDPGAVAKSLAADFASRGVQFFYGTPYRTNLGNRRIRAGETVFSYGTFVNAGGLHADRIARDFGFARNVTILPFKGVYLEYEGATAHDRPVRTNIDPFPGLAQPFPLSGRGSLPDQGRRHGQDRPDSYGRDPRLLAGKRRRGLPLRFPGSPGDSGMGGPAFCRKRLRLPGSGLRRNSQVFPKLHGESGKGARQESRPLPVFKMVASRHPGPAPRHDIPTARLGLSGGGRPGVDSYPERLLPGLHGEHPLRSMDARALRKWRRLDPVSEQNRGNRIILRWPLFLSDGPGAGRKSLRLPYSPSPKGEGNKKLRPAQCKNPSGEGEGMLTQ